MKILVFGSTNIDHNYQMEHIARPKETITSLGYEIHPGGKGLNQAIAFAKTGQHVYLAAVVGNDSGMLLDVLDKYNLTLPSIFVVFSNVMIFLYKANPS